MEKFIEERTGKGTKNSEVNVARDMFLAQVD